MSREHAVRLGVDLGGTFTEVALLVGDALTTTKVPMTEPQRKVSFEGSGRAVQPRGSNRAMST